MHYSLSELQYVYFWDGDSVTKEFSSKITKENADNLHGINYYNPILKPRSYNSTVMRFIDQMLTPTDTFDYKTACEVNTRIYIRDTEGKWKPVPKRKFWKDQCELLWDLWKNFVKCVRPLERWSEILLEQIDTRRSDGKFRYNPLLSVKSRRRLREIYQKHVFNRKLYDEEKGRPGRPKKVKAQPIQSASDRIEPKTKNQQSTFPVLQV